MAVTTHKPRFIEPSLSIARQDEYGATVVEMRRFVQSPWTGLVHPSIVADETISEKWAG
jgi:hypothetical protein